MAEWKDYLKILNSAEKVEDIPNSRFSTIVKKIVSFLDGFTIDEIQKLKCNSASELNYLVQRVRYSAKHLLPKQFYITSQTANKEYVIYIKRRENLENAN